MKSQIDRISITIPKDLLKKFDVLVDERGFKNRSQAVTELIQKEIDDATEEQGDKVMSGSITLFYRNGKNNLKTSIANIQRTHIAEVISSLHVHLEEDSTMEVIVVQGPANTLNAITNKFAACKGVIRAQLTLSSTIIPQLHQ